MTMYDKLGALLSEALESGEIPKTNSDSPRSDAFFESNKSNQTTFSAQEQHDSRPKVTVFTFKRKSPQTEPQNRYQIIKNFIPEDIKSALAFLGIPESATFDEAKKIYREKLMYYHPDHRANNAVLQKVAKEKTARLLKEWEKIEKWYEKC